MKYRVRARDRRRAASIRGKREKGKSRSPFRSLSPCQASAMKEAARKKLLLCGDWPSMAIVVIYFGNRHVGRIDDER